MLDWIPEELLVSLAPLSLSSVVPSAAFSSSSSPTSAVNYYRYQGGVTDNPSFRDANREDWNKTEEYLENNNVDLLKMNANRWEDHFVLPLDDYYLQLWKRWAGEYELQIQGERRRELTRLKRNVKSVMKKEMEK